MWLLFGALFLACPKNRLGQSGSTAVPNRAGFDALLLKLQRSSDALIRLKMSPVRVVSKRSWSSKNLEQFRMEISNMRAELEEMSFAYRQT